MICREKVGGSQRIPLLTKRKDYMKEFRFGVSAVLTYTVEAETEEEARKLLVKEGGLSILADDTLVDKMDYEMADLYDES